MSRHLVLISFALILAGLWLVGFSVTGMATIEESAHNKVYRNFVAFQAKATDDLWEHGSWSFGGFEKAQFFVDAGGLKAFVDAGDVEWCPGILKDWKVYHDFQINVDRLLGKTSFLVDGELYCEIQKIPRPSKLILRDKNMRETVTINFTQVKAG